MRGLYVVFPVLALATACATTPPTKTAKPAEVPFAAVFYTACMQVELPQTKDRRVANNVCQIQTARMAPCEANLGNDQCKRILRNLNADLEAAGSSFVFTAAHAGRTDLVGVLIGLGANVNKHVENRWTPLMIAAGEGHEITVATLLQAGADVNAQNDLGRTALMFAARYGYTAIAKDLLAHGADPNIITTDDMGFTALMAAARDGHIETVRVLLDRGADMSTKDKKGKTAVMWAEDGGHSEVARMLRETGLGK